MKRLAALAPLFVLSGQLVLAEENPAPTPGRSEKFSIGQVWRYATREGEEESRVHIGMIEAMANGDVIVHIKITGLHLRAPGGSEGSVVGHMPLTEQALEKSVTELTGETADLEGLEGGHATWLEAYRSGKGGVFTLSVAEAVDLIQRMISGDTTNER